MIRFLGDSSLADVALSGGKGAGLARLAASGLPMPPGFVVPTTAQGWEADVRAAYAELGRLVGQADPVVAVRGSSPYDDGTYRSAAGLLETRLGVVGADEVVAAVADLRRASPDLLDAYLGAPHAGSMAVVVQQLVPAAFAGVAFTVHPVTGEDDVVVIEAVRGLGDAVTGGSVVPETTVVDRESLEVVEQISPAGVVLDDDRAAQVAQMAVRAEQWQGAPADMEWAMAPEASVHVIQVRPITTLAG